MSAAAKSPGKFTISQAIDSLGVSKFTISIFFLVGIAMMFDGYDYMIISYTNTQIMQEFYGPAGNDALKGALSSWSTIGIVVGSFAAGPLSDKFGRRKILTIGTFMYGLLTIPCIFAPNYEVFAVFRVLAGLFLGVCTPIVTTLFTEFTPTKQRSFFITFGMAWMIVGWVMAALVGTVMVQVATWHWCYAIGALPVIYAFIFGKFTPESAHWCAVHGKLDGAVKTLERIEKRAGKEIPYELKPENLLVPPVSAKSSPAEVWKGKYLKTTIALVIIYFAGNFSIYGVNAWLPALMLEATGGAVTASYMLAMAQNAASVVANCTTGFVSEAMGRKRNLIFGYGLSVVACLYRLPGGQAARRDELLAVPDRVRVHGLRPELRHHRCPADDVRVLSHRVPQLRCCDHRRARQVRRHPVAHHPGRPEGCGLGVLSADRPAGRPHGVRLLGWLPASQGRQGHEHRRHRR